MAPLPARSQASTGSDKVIELESLRGLAALLVVFVHLPKWHPALDARLIHNAHLMVEFFFVLSGYVVYTAYAGRIGSARELAKFQFLRFGRLYPVHLLFLLAFLLYETARWAAAEFGGVRMNVTPFQSNNAEAFWLHIFLLQAIGPTGHDLTFNDPAWSISVEFYAYLIFGVIVLMAGRWRDQCIALLWCMVFWLFVSDQSYGFDRLVRGLVGFFLGCVIARWMTPITAAVRVWAGPWLFGAIVLYLCLKVPGSYDWGIFFLSAMLIASVLGPSDSTFRRLLRSSPLAWLGSISYSLYLAHALLILLFDAGIRRLFGVRTRVVDGIPTPQLDTPGFLLATVAVLAVVLMVSHITYTWVEMPCRAWSRRFAKRRFGE